MVRIHDHYAPADFMVLDMGEEEDDMPSILGRPFLNTTNIIIYVGSRQVHLQFPREVPLQEALIIQMLKESTPQE